MPVFQAIQFAAVNDRSELEVDYIRFTICAPFPTENSGGHNLMRKGQILYLNIFNTLLQY